MTHSSEMIAALKPVAEVLTDLNIRFFVGGSVASSYHGASRSTMDVDIVADIKAPLVETFIEKLGDEYYCSKPAILDAIERTSCFNLIHYSTSFKIDIFVFRGRPFDVDSMKRAIIGQLDDESGIAFPIASPEDTIVSKLEWFRIGNETSERQWEDVSRVLRILGDKADIGYLKSAAEAVGVQDLLVRLLSVVEES